MEWAWIASTSEQGDLAGAVEEWIAARFPHRFEFEEHEHLTTEFLRLWMEEHAGGSVFAGILEGDGGPMIVAFERSEDAALFRLRFT